MDVPDWIALSIYGTLIHLLAIKGILHFLNGD